MSKSMLALSVGICMIQTAISSTAFADAAGAPSSKNERPSPTFERGSCFDQGYQPEIKVWGDAEYLLWWSKDAPVHVPLITKGSITDPVPAAIGQPGTRVLFGKESIDFHAQSGFRLALRTWFGGNRKFGVETSGFYLPTVRKHSSYSSDSDGFPILGVPFENQAPIPLPAGSGGWLGLNSGDTALLAANGTTQFGEISVASSTQLWGLQLNGLFNFLSFDTFKLSAVAGALYIDLQDSLRLHFESQVIGNDLDVFIETDIIDQFRTHNEFYGAQLGLKGEWSQEWVFINFEAKLGLGDMHQVTHIKGEFADPSPNLYNNYGTGSGTGIFAQPTNIGEHSKDRFAVAPQFLFRFGVNLIKNLRVSVGYDFLYLCNVVRPGEQIDDEVNETQAGPDLNHAKPLLTGPERPKVLHKTTDYWAQGINVGFEYRF